MNVLRAGRGTGYALALLTALCCVASATAAEALGPRHHEPSGGFSYRPPRGWAVQPIPGARHQYAVFLAKGFTPIISVDDEEFAGPFEEYVAGLVRGMEHVFPDYHELSREPFTTTSGLLGTHLVVTLTQLGKPLRQSLFFIDGGNGRKYLLKGSALAADGEQRDAPFSEAARSFLVEPIVAPKAP